ncbi:MAG: VCBS repeat-containing protein, partial [Thermodesulfobacteriota bacterium]
DILTAKLTWADKVQVVPKSEAQAAFDQAGGRVDEGMAKQIAAGLGVNYVVFGTLTVIGNNVSLEATLVDLGNQSKPVKVSRQSQGLNTVMPAVDRFAEDINTQVFNRPAGAPVVAAAPQPMPQPLGETKPAQRHPQYSLTGKEGQQLSPLNPNFIAAPGADEDAGKFWRSPSFPVAVNGMDVADMDGDGQNEVVYASDNTVFVARISGVNFQVVASYKGLDVDRFLTLDVADLNHNGRPEVFVSNQRRLEAKSLVLEMVEGKLTPIVKNSNWYYRVMNQPGGKVLVGQMGGTGELLLGELKILQWSNGNYLPQNTISLPPGFDIFNVTLARLEGGSKEHVVGVNYNDKLVVLSRGGQRIWKSKDYFCEGMLYVEEPRINNPELGHPKPNRKFLPTRILAVDLDGDGVQEILVPQNSREGTRWLEGVRAFDQGEIYSLSLSQMAVRENWRTKPLPGYLADYQVADYNNDGRLDLVLAVVMKHGTGVFDSRSAIVAYELASPEELKAARTAGEGGN